ncbi:MAG TPA: hypothetical protein VJU82_02040 [Acidobacteriaceae bacterium]|nr:hypothetical protein [Acidobacteriaceae bacterium]
MQRFGWLAVLNLMVTAPTWCQNARFDLTGPKVDVRVTRGSVTLPIASVPNLQPGDKLWVHPDLPPTQSVRYLMVVTFLRGTTNPPPDHWFTRVATWEKKVREEGVVVTVPEEAQQAVIFLAPVTGGDFSTLRSAVQGRPGIFVRASQDLAAAGFEQARIEKYIASMKQLTPAEAADPKQLQEHSNFLAATLALKPNGECVKLPADQQYTCLTQSGNQNLLDDGHGQSIVDALTSGTSAGLIGTVSTTQLAGGGVYSAYVGAVVDLVHIMGSLHTAQYQYIPAIAFPQQQAMNLRLNTPPSFHNPKSVIVIGLPSVQKTVPPPLRAADPKHVSCLVQPELVLPMEGAPLVFSTAFAHDLVLHLNRGSSGKDIPLAADAFRGGLVVAPAAERRPLAIAERESSASSAAPAEKPVDGHLTGTIEGYWGFDRFTGPTMPLQVEPGKDWKVSEDGWLIAGKHGHVALTSTGTACIQEISIEPASGEHKKEDWKQADKPNTVDVTVDVPEHASGAMHLSIRQYGDPKPDTVSLVAYGEPAKIEGLQYHAGDEFATLEGSGLDQVRSLELDGVNFQPAGKSGGGAGLQLDLASGSARPKLAAGASVEAHVALRDGRSLPVKFNVEPSRPSLTLINRVHVPAQANAGSALPIKLGSDNDLPISDELVFSVKSDQPFARNSAIEIASPDGSLHAKLSLDEANRDAKPALMLQDPRTLVVTLQPVKLFGRSAFGPIRFRAVAPDGTTGDWIPLVTLVRLPAITGLACQNAQPAAAASGDDSVAAAPAAASCTLTGSDLFLIDSVSATESDQQPVKVPEGFVGTSISVPPPTGAAYYIRLRDDPAAVDAVSLPAGPIEAPAT